MECKAYPSVKRNLALNLHNTQSQALKIILVFGPNPLPPSRPNAPQPLGLAKFYFATTASWNIHVSFNPSSTVGLQQVLWQLIHFQHTKYLNYRTRRAEQTRNILAGSRATVYLLQGGTMWRPLPTPAHFFLVPPPEESYSQSSGATLSTVEESTMSEVPTGKAKRKSGPLMVPDHL